MVSDLSPNCPARTHASIKDSCDVGTMPNQTRNGLPLAATQDGDTGYGGALCAFTYMIYSTH